MRIWQRGGLKYVVGDFIFPSKECYEKLKEIDRDVDIILSDLGEDEEDLKDFLNKIGEILIFEKYFSSYSTMMRKLFPNINKMLNYYSYGENKILEKKYKFALFFLRNFSFTGQ